MHVGCILTLFSNLWQVASTGNDANMMNNFDDNNRKEVEKLDQEHGVLWRPLLPEVAYLHLKESGASFHLKVC